MRYVSPLRYPGGKGAMAKYLGNYLRTKSGVTRLVEPFAGGAGASLKLLLQGVVRDLVLNDADDRIFAFWNSVFFETAEFLSMLEDVPISVNEWLRQRAIYRSNTASSLEVGFATFYLNRCNRSGIINNGSVIGGLEQTGKWGIDSRFNKPTLAHRVSTISQFREHVTIHCDNAIDRLPNYMNASDTFLFLDPPYYFKSEGLYLNTYSDSDHRELCELMRGPCQALWLVSYDDAPRIREIWAGFDIREHEVDYSAHQRRRTSEILIAPPGSGLVK